MILESQEIIPKKKYKIKSFKIIDEPLIEEERMIYDSIRNYIEKNVFIWDMKNSDNFKFNLPNSIFNQNLKINLKVWEDQEITYDESYLTRDLTREQLNEIRETGKFSVKSKIVNLPYIWQLSKWLIKGSHARIESFYYDMNLAFKMFYYLNNRFSFQKENYFCSFPFCLIFIWKGFKEIYHLIFGRPRYNFEYMNRVQFPNNYKSQVFSEFQSELIRNNPLINTKIFYPKAQSIICKIWNDFQMRWSKDKILVEHDLRQQNLTNQEFEDKLSETRFNKLIEEYEKTTKLCEYRKKGVVEMLRVKSMLNFIIFDFNKKISDAKKVTEQNIRIENPIKSLSDDWLIEECNRRMKNQILEFEYERDNRIVNEITEYPTQKLLVESKIKFDKNYDEIYQEWNKKLPVIPFKSFYIYKKYFPPYPIIKNEKLQTYYLFKEDFNFKLDTISYFWRIKLMFYKFWESYSNVLIFGYWTIWNSSFGLKALFLSQIEENYTCDINTGELLVTSYGFTYPSSIIYISKWISNSRDEFEKHSDTGFLSGKIGKLLNLFENYFLKLICWGSLVVLLYPFCIIISSIFCSVLMLLGLIFVTIFIPLAQLISIFLINFDNYETDCCVILPFFWIFTKRIMVQGIFHFMLTIIVLLAQILVGIIMFIFAFLRWTIRFIYDSITYSLIRCNALIPKSDTSVAWRISGPGYSRQLYIKIEIEEALLLVRATIEKLELNHYDEKMKEIINEPRKIYEGIQNRLLSRLNGYIKANPKLIKSIKLYLSKLDEQVNDRMKIFPEINSNIRFSQSELELLNESSYQLIKDCVEKNRLDFIWNMNGLLPGNWQLLTERILISTFTESILTSIDDSEIRKQNNKPKSEIIIKLEEELDLINYKKIAYDRLQNKSNHNMKLGFSLFGGSSHKTISQIKRLNYDNEHYDYKHKINRNRQNIYANQEDLDRDIINNSYNDNQDIYPYISIQVQQIKDETRRKIEQEEDNGLDDNEMENQLSQNIFLHNEIITDNNNIESPEELEIDHIK